MGGCQEAADTPWATRRETHHIGDRDICGVQAADRQCHEQQAVDAGIVTRRRLADLLAGRQVNVAIEHVDR